MVSDFFLDRHAPPALAKTTEGGAYPSAQLKYIEQPLKKVQQAAATPLPPILLANSFSLRPKNFLPITKS
jgi:hypothetical protein